MEFLVISHGLVADLAGLVDQLLQTLKSIDPSRGDRLDDRPEVEQMYQASVGLQGQINALIKKYSDQKGEFTSAFRPGDPS